MGQQTQLGTHSGISLNWILSPIGGPLPQASPVSVYLFPGERSGAQPPSTPPGGSAGSLGSRSEAKEEEKEEEGDGDTLDSDEFCILDAPGLGIPVCAVGAALLPPFRLSPSGAPSVREQAGTALALGLEGTRGFPEDRRPGILSRGTGTMGDGGRGGAVSRAGDHVAARPVGRAREMWTLDPSWSDY